MQITKENIINKLCFSFFLFLNVFYLVCIDYLLCFVILLFVIPYSCERELWSEDLSFEFKCIFLFLIIYIQLWRMKLFGFRFLYIHSGEDSLIRKFFNKIRDSRLTNFVVLTGAIVLDFVVLYFIHSYRIGLLGEYIIYTVLLGGIFINYLSLSIWLRCKDKYEAILQKPENNKVLNKLKKVTIFLIKNLFLIIYILMFGVFSVVGVIAFGLLLGFI